MKRQESGMAMLAGIAMVVVLCLLGARMAQGQDGMYGQGHEENHHWYQELKQPGSGYSCCNESDCRPTRAYVNDDGNWMALIDGRWREIPLRAIIQRMAPDGNSHVCAGKDGTIYCFIGGVPKS